MTENPGRLSFGASAELYDAARPRYPLAAVRWMLGPAACRVADVGAGTGIFTRLVAGLGHDVVGVEPDPRMRSRFVASSPGLDVVAGSAESLPLASESVDAVTAAQAVHWFDGPRAFPEIARVLRPGGVFASICGDGSLAITSWPSATRVWVSLPVPAPSSRSRTGAAPVSQETASSG